MLKIEYIQGAYTLSIKRVKVKADGRLPGQCISGYGDKIATHWILRFDGESYTYRVYATTYSNVASYWITRRGQKQVIKHLSRNDTNES